MPLVMIQAMPQVASPARTVVIAALSSRRGLAGRALDIAGLRMLLRRHARTAAP